MRTLRISCLSLSTAVVISSLAPLAWADNITVPGDFPTIQEAIDAASPGDRILVAAGNHAGASIDKRVRISGVGDETVITDGPIFGVFHDAFRLFPGADKSEISDLKI